MHELLDEGSKPSCPAKEVVSGGNAQVPRLKAMAHDMMLEPRPYISWIILRLVLG